MLSIQGWLTVGFFGALAIKLSVAYLCLIPALCLFWFNAYRGKLTVRISWVKLHAPLLFFALYCGLAALLGLNPTKSLNSLISLTFLSTTCFLIAWYVEHYGILGIITVFLGGQGIAALNAVMASGSAGVVPRIFLGEVTQAGQFGIGLVLGFSWLSAKPKPTLSPQFSSQVSWAGGIFLLSLLIGFFSSPSTLPLFVTTLGLTIVVWCRTIFRLRSPEAKALAFCSLWIPLIAAGLIIDLKRGPWMGAWAGIALIIAARNRRLIALFLASSGVAAIALQPVAHRLGATFDHFFIAGGRSSIWQIGGQLIQQFPLGIGLKNSSILRSFSYQIPPELTHFHSNIINLVVETGVLGAALYLWWIFSICTALVKKGASTWVAALPPLITWQVAGLVEYNIGDKEVILVVYLAIGMAYSLIAQEHANDWPTCPQSLSFTSDSIVESA